MSEEDYEVVNSFIDWLCAIIIKIREFFAGLGSK